MDKSVCETIGKNLWSIRERRKLKQEEVAEMADISQSFYANIEQGRKGVSIETLIRLAEVLEVSIDALVYGESEDTCVENIGALLRNCTPSFKIMVEDIVRRLVQGQEDKDSGMMN